MNSDFEKKYQQAKESVITEFIFPYAIIFKKAVRDFLGGIKEKMETHAKSEDVINRVWLSSIALNNVLRGLYQSEEPYEVKIKCAYSEDKFFLFTEFKLEKDRKNDFETFIKDANSCVISTGELDAIFPKTDQQTFKEGILEIMLNSKREMQYDIQPSDENHYLLRTICTFDNQ